MATPSSDCVQARLVPFPAPIIDMLSPGNIGSDALTTKFSVGSAKDRM